MMAERYKLGDIDNERFYMLPKGLFTNPSYKDISIAAKVTYALFKDRMELSRKNGWHDDNGDIYLVYPSEQIEKDLNIAHSTASKVINELRTVGLIDTVRQGLGKANIIYIKKFEIHTSESMKSEHQEVRNSYSNDTESSDTEISDTKNILSGKPDYAQEREEIINYLNEKSGKAYRPNSDKTKRLISARLNEGFTVEDFKTVIDNKVSSWLGNKDMEKYLRPETLFSPKFEGYLNEKQCVDTKSTSPSGIRTNADWGAYDG
jgi:uncharacterized phage protein (TIGR02220 family)